MNNITTRLKSLSPYALTLALFVLGTDAALAQSEQLKIGKLAEGASENFIGLTTFAKVGAAFAGFCMVIYCLYALSFGRKKDEREYPVMQSVVIGLVGSLLMSIAVMTGIFNTTLLGTESDAEDGLSTILEE